MFWCTYCNQEFTKSQHLNRHMLTHTSTNAETFECSICSFSSQRRDVLQHHYDSVHQEQDETVLGINSNDPQGRNIACKACAKAKTRCDRVVPTCRRCEEKGLPCEPRSSKRSNDAAIRLARQRYQQDRKPINIAPFPGPPKQESPDFDHYSDSRQWTTSAHDQYALTTPYDGFNSSSTLPSAAGFQTNPQNYPWRSPYYMEAFASGGSSHGNQVGQVPGTSVDRYYGQTMDPSVASPSLSWASPYSVAGTAAAFSGSNEAYAYGRDMLLESPSTGGSSTGRDTFGDLGFGTPGMQGDFMTPYSDTMPESPEYYRPA